MYDTTIGWRFVNKLMKAQYGIDSMPETADNVAAEFRIARADQDAFALRQQQQGLSQAAQNKLSVKLELHAVCLAGVWAARANEAKQILDTGDIEEALTAASAIGDDRLQQQSRGTVAPDCFTDGR